MEQFQTHLQIESEIRVRDALVHACASTISNASQNNLGNKNQNLKVSKKFLDKKKKNMNCYHCGKKGHKI